MAVGIRGLKVTAGQHQGAVVNRRVSEALVYLQAYFTGSHNKICLLMHYGGYLLRCKVYLLLLLLNMDNKTCTNSQIMSLGA